MKIVRTVSELHTALAVAGDVGLVPTMGAFHEGHLSLFRAARAENDVVAVSLFVNPAQFEDGDDLERYPRDEHRDIGLAGAEGVDVLFAPSAEELYPAGFSTWVDPGEAGAEGVARPGHFRAVATICVKLFHLVQPRRAYFGQKDAQQAAVLRRVVQDLNIDLELRILPTVRDADGLARSSRNSYLTPRDRGHALRLYRALSAGRAAHASGGDPVAATRAALNGLEPEYVEVLDLGAARVLATAARVGRTRLIDNVLLEGDLR